MLNTDTQIPAPRVPISEQNNIPTREWFRFFNAIYTFLGLSNNVIPVSSGGTGLTSYAVGDLLYATASDTLTRLPVATTPSYLGTDSTHMPQWIAVAYGSFLSTTTVTPAASTPTAIVFDTTAYSRYVSISGSQVTVEKTGLYSISFSIQLANATSADDDAIVWLRVNGADVANTASYISVIKTHAGVPGNLIVTLTLLQQLTAGDYFEIYGLSILGNVSFKTYPASTSPAYPASPNTILTVSQII
jgi:hypothetical protein